MRTIIITGASDGIGAAAAEQLAGQLGASETRLVLVGRSPEKTRAVAERVGAGRVGAQHGVADVEHYVADFERLDEVRDLAEVLRQSCGRIDVLANNAGGLFSGPHQTVDGFEKTFQVNHLAPYLLTSLLIDVLVAGRAAVVNTSSVAARIFSGLDLDDLQTTSDYRPNRAYGNAKLANVLFTKGLHARFADQGLASVAFHPGNVATNFASETTSWLRRVYHGTLATVLTSPEQGGATLAHFIAGEPGADWTSGQYYTSRRRRGRTSRAAENPAVVRRHWELSAQMLDVQW